jgi:N-methylhydantoinase A
VRAVQLDERPVWFATQGATLTPTYARAKLQAGNRLTGPALVLQYDATVVITPGWMGRVDEFGNLWLEMDRASLEIKSGI